MTIKEFNDLYDFEKLDLINFEGKFLHVIAYKRNTVELYKLYDFYVEAHYSSAEQMFVKIVAFDSERKLNKFIKTLKLSDDLV